MLCGTQEPGLGAPPLQEIQQIFGDARGPARPAGVPEPCRVSEQHEYLYYIRLLSWLLVISSSGRRFFAGDVVVFVVVECGGLRLVVCSVSQIEALTYVTGGVHFLDSALLLPADCVQRSPAAVFTHATSDGAESPSLSG